MAQRPGLVQPVPTAQTMQPVPTVPTVTTVQPAPTLRGRASSPSRSRPRAPETTAASDSAGIAPHAETAEATMRECADLGIARAWMHRSFGRGSVSDAATRYGRQHGVQVIDGGCPCMYGTAADAGHKVMCTMLQPTRKLPRQV
jgi:hypothetical protein